MIFHRTAHHLGRRRRRRRGKRRKPPAPACARAVAAGRQSERERGNNTGTAAGSSEGGLPRLSVELSSASICRYSPRVRYYRTLERAGAGAALKHMSAFVCHRDSLRCSLARSLVCNSNLRNPGSRRLADLTRDSSSVFLSRRSCNSRASLSFSFSFFF